LLQCFYDDRLVRPPEAQKGAADSCDCRSWLIAFFEYCFQVPANRIGYGEFTAFQLKIIQEVITLCVFVAFAWIYLGEHLRWNHMVSFLFIVGAVVFGFWGKL
jgi:uncharacterized protein (DUF486 family)